MVREQRPELRPSGEEFPYQHFLPANTMLLLEEGCSEAIPGCQTISGRGISVTCLPVSLYRITIYNNASMVSQTGQVLSFVPRGRKPLRQRSCGYDYIVVRYNETSPAMNLSCLRQQNRNDEIPRWSNSIRYEAKSMA